MLCLRVIPSFAFDWLDLPALESIQTGCNAFYDTESIQLNSVQLVDGLMTRFAKAEIAPLW